MPALVFCVQVCGHEVPRGEKGRVGLQTLVPALSGHLRVFVFQGQLSATSGGYQDNEVQGEESLFCGFPQRQCLCLGDS